LATDTLIAPEIAGPAPLIWFDFIADESPSRR
jgi:hypothetical protein